MLKPLNILSSLRMVKETFARSQSTILAAVAAAAVVTADTEKQRYIRAERRRNHRAYLLRRDLKLMPSRRIDSPWQQLYAECPVVTMGIKY